MTDRRDQVEQKVVDDIATHGWAAIAVFPTETPGTPGNEFFTYSIGFTALLRPEMIVMGLPQVQAHGILRSAYVAIKKGVRFLPDTYASEILQDMSVGIVEVLEPLGEFPMTMANRIYGEISALQIVWPDMNEKFPWDPDFDPEYLQRQPLLGIWSGSTAPA